MTGPEEAVRDWLRTTAGGDLILGSLEPLGGFSADARRLDVSADGRSWSFVVKRPRHPSREAAVLQLVQAVPLAARRVPTLVGHGADDAGPWLVATFERGDHPAVVPDAVFDTLARVHAHAHDPEALALVPRLDVGSWTRFCARVSQTVERCAPAQERAELMAASRRWAADRRIGEALDALPTTLVHRDVHTLNVVVDGEVATLIDWGDALRGPAWLDLPNSTQRGTTAMAAYDAAWFDVTGDERDTVLDDVGWAWAQAQVLVQYLPYAVEHVSVDRARRMAADADDSLGELGAALRGLG